MSGNSQAQRILRLLQQAGSEGVPNYKLAAISLQYNARVFTLRHRHGYDIRKKRRYYGAKPSETFIYYLVPKKAPEPLVAPVRPPERVAGTPLTLLDVDPVKPRREMF